MPKKKPKPLKESLLEAPSTHIVKPGEHKSSEDGYMQAYYDVNGYDPVKNLIEMREKLAASTDLDALKEAAKIDKELLKYVAAQKREAPKKAQEKEIHYVLHNFKDMQDQQKKEISAQIITPDFTAKVEETADADS